MTNQSQMRGFTLIEIMIVVAIVAVLAGIALPIYSDSVRRGQLPEAFNNLANYRVQLEQFYQDNKVYGTAACADGANAPTWNTFVPTGAKYFTFACALTNGGQGYTLTATGAAGRSVGNVYTINEANAKTTTKFKGTTVAKNCWLSQGSEC